MIEKEEEKSFASFGKSFQEKLSEILLDEPEFFDQISEILKIEFFELKYLQEFVKILFDYREKFAKHPNRDTVESILKNELLNLNPQLQKQVRDFYTRVAANDIGNVNQEYVKNKSIDFCKKQNLKQAFIKSIKLMETSSFEEIQKIINNSLNLGLFNDYGHDFLTHFEERYKFKSRDPISTGWKPIDDITGGGLGKGELTVVMAVSGAGKSMALVHLGAQALKAGKTVVHYTLELSDKTVGRRYDSCLTGYPLSSLNNVKDDVYEEIAKVPGKLIVKEYPTKSVGISSLRSHLEKLKQRDIIPDMVIIDYADLLRASHGKTRELRHELQELYENIRALAMELDITIVTASQVNRSAVNAEVVTMESISEAFNKCFVADFIFSLARTIDDRNNNTAKLFVAKNRNGEDGVLFPSHMDTSKVEIEVFERFQETIEEVQKDAVKKQKVRLQEKYKEFREKNKNDKE